MKSVVENISPSRIKITIEMPFADLQPSMDSAYARISSQINIPGFRKGKIPTRIIDQRVGRGVVLEEAVNDAIPSGLAQAMIENNIVQLGRPEVDVTTLDEETGLIFTAELDVRPEFDLPKFDALRVVVDDAEVTTDQVEEQLTGLRGRFGALKEVSRAAKDTDVLLVDLKGDHEGQVVEELAATAFSYELGSDDMVPGFDDAVRGAKANEVRHFVFTPTAGQWSGKGITVEVTVNAVRERELSDADDEFAQLASEFDTIGELREDIRTRLGRVRLIEQAYQARDLTHDALMEAVKMDLPERTIQDEIDAHFNDGHGDDAHRAEFESNARSGIKSRLVLDKVAEVEELQVNDAELSQWLVQEAQRYNMAPDQFADQLVQSGQVQGAVSEVRRAKALAHVLENISVVDKSGNEIDLESVLRGDDSDVDFDTEFDAGSDEENPEADK